MYAKIAATTWDHESPTRSHLEGCDLEFDHERDCPMYERMDRECDCYVSRIRLIKTPVGRTIPTTEPDLSDPLDMWIRLAGERKGRAEKVQRENNILWVGLILTSVAALIAVSRLVFELGLI